MANQKTSELTERTTAAGADEVAVRVGSSNFRMKLSNLIALATGTVTSVFGRSGAVTAQTSDYDASQVDNDSGVSGATVAAALNTLDSGKAASGHAHSLNDLSNVSVSSQASDDLLKWNGTNWINITIVALKTLLNYTLGSFVTLAGEANDDMIVRHGGSWQKRTPTEVRAHLDLEVGTDIQGYDADTAKTDVAQSYSKNQYYGASAISHSATHNINLDDNPHPVITVGGNTTIDLAAANMRQGAAHLITLEMDGTGGYTVSFNGTRFAGTVTVDNAANARTTLVIVIDDGVALMRNYEAQT